MEVMADIHLCHQTVSYSLVLITFAEYVRCKASHYEIR